MTLHIYLQLIENYITHSHCIYTNSPPYMRRQHFVIGINHCLKLRKWIEAYRSKITEEAIIKQVHRYSDYLWWILPHSNNPSYNSSLKNLMRILEQATHIIPGERKTLCLNPNEKAG